VVALQEADGPSTWSGDFDHVATLARLIGLRHHFRGDHHRMSVGRFCVEYGTALLSRHPMYAQASHRFAENWRDTKGFVVATVQVPEWGEREVDFVSVHLDFLAPSVRRRQIRQLTRVLERRRHPLVLLGDFNCNWEVEPRTMALLTGALGLRAHQTSHFPTYPAIRPVRRLDWILISEELDFGGAHFALPHHVSDHLGVVADLRLRGHDEPRTRP
jgi:endonuclease/exonuclease/phosphatase family metal-dependent hydrolase